MGSAEPSQMSNSQQSQMNALRSKAMPAEHAPTIRRPPLISIRDPQFSLGRNTPKQAKSDSAHRLLVIG